MRQVLVDVDSTVVAQLVSALPMFGVHVRGSRESDIEGAARLVLEGAWLPECEQPTRATISFMQHVHDQGMQVTMNVARIA